MPIPPQPLQYIPKADEISDGVDRRIQKYKTCIDAILRDVTPATATFDTVIRPLIETADQLQGEVSVVGCLWYVSPDKATRDLVRKEGTRFSTALNQLFKGEGLFKLLEAVRDKGEDLDSEDAKLVKDYLWEFEATGHGVLSEEEVEEYTRRREEIDELRRTFNANLSSDEDGVWFTLDELTGLREDQIAGFAEGTEFPNVGKRFVSFRRGDHRAVMQYAEDPKTRKAYYLAGEKKLAHNVPIFEKVIRLRDINARLLGYSSHADFRLQTRMAESPEWVEGFLEILREGLTPLAKKDLEKLHAIKKQYLASTTKVEVEGADGFFPWDRSYYTRIAKEQANVQQQQIAEYFPLQHTLKAMVGLFRAYLGLEFVPIPKEELTGRVWHDDVEVFSVWEGKGGESPEGFVGYLYTDLMWREGKYRGNQNVNLQRGYTKPDGGRVYPATILMCSFPEATATKCPLLEHSELVTLFHELGHGIHDLLSRTKHNRFHSYNGARDFGEAPSVFLENFCWLKDELKEMSCHYTKLDPKYLLEWQQRHPGEAKPLEKIPDHLLDSLIDIRHLMQGWWCSDQLATAIFDMKIHNPPSHQALFDIDVTALYNDLIEEIGCLRNPDPSSHGHPHVHFGHLLSGYDAGYYAYSWAWVFAADVFGSKFARNPRDREVWEQYRRMVLEPGGSKDELRQLEKFLGRPLKPAPFFRQLGLE